MELILERNMIQYKGRKSIGNDNYKGKYTRRGKSRFTVVSMQNTVYSCIMTCYYIIFHVSICKPTFAHSVYFN